MRVGDRPKRPFNVDRFFRWRLFEDYAGGPSTDVYPHCVTQLVDILSVGFPDVVVATGGIHRYDYKLREVPDTFNLLAQYPEKVTTTPPTGGADRAAACRPSAAGTAR